MPDLIIVTRTWEDGSVESWRTENGDTEANMRRRMRAAGRPHRKGPGWLELDREADGLTYTERLEWSGGEAS